MGVVAKTSAVMVADTGSFTPNTSSTMFRYWSSESSVSRAEANDAPCTHCAALVPVPPPDALVPLALPLDPGGAPPPGVT